MGILTSNHSSRRLSRFDRFLNEIDTALRTLVCEPKTTRPRPDLGQKSTLSTQEAQKSAALMRVNHVGEVCAQALYRGQAFFANDPKTQAHLLDAAKEHAAEVTDNLVCRTINSVITVKNGKIEVPLGKRHGIKLSALAVTKGEQTPFNILRVDQVLENKSILLPLNNSLEVNKLDGKSIQFLGSM